MGVIEEIKLREREPDGVDPAFRNDVLEGLAQARKAIPARWFYDLEGSELFEQITTLDEYYPTRTEIGLLERHGVDVGAVVGEGRAVVEFGSGSSLKTPLLLSATAPAAYVPLDISGEFLRQSSEALAAKFPQLPVLPVEADFTRPVHLPAEVQDLPMLGFFPGSTIGNMVPRVAIDLLRSMRATLGNGAFLLIGFDRVKDVDRLLAAYDDARGITAAFNLNLLRRINRELDGDIPLSAFRHVARWNPDWSRIEMHLEATRDVAFQIDGQGFEMAAGETIHTENSHKYTPNQARLLLQAAGWAPAQMWTDANDDYLLILAGASEQRAAP